MKILYHHRVASKDGQYVHIAEIIASLRKLGHEVIVCEPASIQSTEFGQGSGLVDRVRALLPGFIHELAELLYSVPDYLKLRRMIRQHRPDCIYERYNLYFTSGIHAARRFGLPLLLEVNAPLYLERLKNNQISLRWLARWSEDHVWNRADRVLPVTGVLAKMVMERGVPDARMTVIHNGISADFCEQLPDPALLDQTLDLEGKLVLGFTGFVREWHGLDRVLEVIAANADQPWHLLLVGDGPDRERLETIAARLGVSGQLTITGIVGREEMPGYVQRFDIALQPDVVAYASPLKMFEYLALGRPIVAPDTENIREILADDHNALLFQPGDDSFGRQLLRLCEDPALRQRLGAAARDTIDAQGLYWDENARRITACFEQLLADDDLAVAADSRPGGSEARAGRGDNRLGRASLQTACALEIPLYAKSVTLPDCIFCTRVFPVSPNSDIMKRWSRLARQRLADQPQWRVFAGKQTDLMSLMMPVFRISGVFAILAALALPGVAWATGAGHAPGWGRPLTVPSVPAATRATTAPGIIASTRRDCPWLS